MTRMMLGHFGTATICLGLWLAPLAEGKDFKPGDVRICVAAKCLRLDDRAALDSLSTFYYSRKYIPQTETAPPAAAPYVEIRYPDGYVTGIAAGPRYDHFLSYGVNLDQFQARTWYAIPARASAEIKRLATKLRPRALPPNVLSNSH